MRSPKPPYAPSIARFLQETLGDPYTSATPYIKELMVNNVGAVVAEAKKGVPNFSRVHKENLMVDVACAHENGIIDLTAREFDAAESLSSMAEDRASHEVASTRRNWSDAVSTEPNSVRVVKYRGPGSRGNRSGGMNFD